jgi:Fe2+ or Zn2+ uptake regulation protein
MEEGKIKKLKLGTSDVYETVKEKHYHFQCKKCGKIMDIPLRDIQKLSVPMEIEGNQIMDHDLILFGYCEECQKSKKEDGKNEEVCM